MQLSDLVEDAGQQRTVAAIVWTLFDASRGQFKIRILFFSFDFEDRVRQWILDKFGPHPLDMESIPAT